MLRGRERPRRPVRPGARARPSRSRAGGADAGRRGRLRPRVGPSRLRAEAVIVRAVFHPAAKATHQPKSRRRPRDARGAHLARRSRRSAPRGLRTPGGREPGDGRVADAPHLLLAHHLERVPEAVAALRFHLAEDDGLAPSSDQVELVAGDPAVRVEDAVAAQAVPAGGAPLGRVPRLRLRRARRRADPGSRAPGTSAGGSRTGLRAERPRCGPG